MDRAKRLRAGQERKQDERLGTREAKCAFCDEADPRCMEAHHVAGRKFSADTILVCRNCHRKLSQAQSDHPLPLGGDPDWAERVGHYLLGIADLLRLVVEKLLELAAVLISKAKLSSGAGEVT